MSRVIAVLDGFTVTAVRSTTLVTRNSATFVDCGGDGNVIGGAVVGGAVVVVGGAVVVGGVVVVGDVVVVVVGVVVVVVVGGGGHGSCTASGGSMLVIQPLNVLQISVALESVIDGDPDTGVSGGVSGSVRPI